MPSTRLSSTLLLACALSMVPRSAEARSDPADDVLTIGVVDRLHRTLDVYTQARLPLVGVGAGARVDGAVAGAAMWPTAHLGGELQLYHLGFVVGVERIWRGLGAGVFHSAAIDTVQTLDVGRRTAFAGRSLTVLGGQVWWGDWVAVAVGRVGEPTDLTDGGPRIELGPAAPLEPLFVRIEVPRLGGQVRLDLGGDGVGRPRFIYDTAGLWDDWRVEVDAGDDAGGLGWYGRARGARRLTERLWVTGLAGGSEAGEGFDLATAGLRARLEIWSDGGDVASWIEGGFELGATRVTRPAMASASNPLGAWGPAVTASCQIWMNEAMGSIGLDIDAGYNRSGVFGALAPEGDLLGVRVGGVMRSSF